MKPEETPWWFTTPEELWLPPKSTVAELMKLAGAGAGRRFARKLLVATLPAVKQVYDELTAARHPVPRKSFDKVATAARALSAAMNALNRQYQPRLAATMEDWLENREAAQTAVLRILAAAEKGARKTKRGQPKKDNKAWVVRHAVGYLRRAAPAKFLSNGRLSAAHLEFIELYYETVTGETGVRGTLEYKIREELRRRAGTSP
jgi:hypothetical protein